MTPSRCLRFVLMWLIYRTGAMFDVTAFGVVNATLGDGPGRAELAGYTRLGSVSTLVSFRWVERQ